jgi:cation-transporting ATPase 13A2
LNNDLVDNVRNYLLDKRVLFNEAMASCHSITYINEELVGDPLEIKMFENTDWILDETNTVSNSLISQNDLVSAYVRPKVDAGYHIKKELMSFEENKDGDDLSPEDLYSFKNYELAIVKRFDFESKLQRMSVIVKNNIDSTFRAYVKGSPEKVADLCLPESLPGNFE